ncbi:MAG: pirin family protein [Gammaproteobacteria bacterium]|nr:pirin family protein [Gammaproteobacteria bacterium]
MSLLQAERQLLPATETVLGEGMRIRRALPTRLRRMVGPWTFMDHFGPVDVAHGDGMRVAPHPHIGLQTVTWLHRGEILHRDSLGSLQTIRPGQLNLMTSGRGISHSEESPLPRSPELHGLQFWIALPDESRAIEAAFDHYPSLPVIERDGLRISVLVGEMLGEVSPARLYSPALGLDMEATQGIATSLPLRPDFEYAALVSEGEAEFDGETLAPGSLLYLGGGRESLAIRTSGAARLTLIGGEPFETPVLMWWNFVARTQDELSTAVREWNAGQGDYGEVHGYDGARLKAPTPPWDKTAAG